MNQSDTDPPDDIPEELIAVLDDSSDSQLRGVIHYAQQLLRDRPQLTDVIESREGEELVRVEDHGAYTIAIVERPGDPGEARGPFAYSVNWEPNIDDEGGPVQVALPRESPQRHGR